jgi:hypothetical protein
MARHTPTPEKMHPYENDKEQNENPVLSDPVHRIPPFILIIYLVRNYECFLYTSNKIV